MTIARTVHMNRNYEVKRDSSKLQCPVCKDPLAAEDVAQKLMLSPPQADGAYVQQCGHCQASFRVPRKEMERLVIEKKTQDLMAAVSRLVRNGANNH